MRYVLRLPVIASILVSIASPALAQYPQYGQQQYPQQSGYPQQASPQTDPSVPGNSSLPAGQYELKNLATGQKRYITVTAQGQMYEQDSPPLGANLTPPAAGGYGGGFAQQGYGMGQAGMGQPGMAQPGMGQPGMGQPGMGQPGMGQPPIVNSAIRGALGQYFANRFGGGAAGAAAGAGGYPSMPSGGYPNYASPSAGAPGTPGASY